MLSSGHHTKLWSDKLARFSQIPLVNSLFHFNIPFVLFYYYIFLIGWSLSYSNCERNLGLSVHVEHTQSFNTLEP